MAIREITYTLSPSGISPAAEQFGGVQGDHRATKLTFKFNGDLVAALNDYNNLHFRFDAYDGEGNVCQTEGKISADNSLEYFLEERLTRAGGKVAVVLVCTQVNDSAETALELYNFPALLRLKNKPQGNGETSENRESYTTLLEAAKNAAGSAKAIADAANNGEFDGKDGVSATHCWNGTELTITSASGTSSVNLKGEKGDQGEQGPKGDQGPQGEPGIITNLDQAYNHESSNAQSGIAVAEAVAPKVTLFEGDELTIPPMGEMIIAPIESNSPLQQAKAGDLYYTKGELLQIINISTMPDIYGRVKKSIAYERMRSYADQEYNPYSSNAQSGTAVAEAISIKEARITDNTTLTVENNKNYIGEAEITNIEITYPSDPFICSLTFTTAAKGDITIKFPDSTKFIGGKPTFSNGETWELNIMNGVVVGGKVYDFT